MPIAIRVDEWPNCGVPTLADFQRNARATIAGSDARARTERSRLRTAENFGCKRLDELCVRQGRSGVERTGIAVQFTSAGHGKNGEVPDLVSPFALIALQPLPLLLLDTFRKEVSEGLICKFGCGIPFDIIVDRLIDLTACAGLDTVRGVLPQAHFDSQPI